MPLIGMRGGMSATGYGMFIAKRIVIPAGTLGVYRDPASDTALYKYTFAGDTVASYGSVVGDTGFRSPNNNRFAVGNGSKGIIGKMNGGNGTNALSRILWASGAVFDGSAINTGNVTSSAAGNSTLAVICGSISGFASAATNVWTYASDSSAPGQSLQNAFASGAACGNNTQMIVAVGTNSTTTNKYTYAGGVTVSTPLITNMNRGAAAGNATIGVFKSYSGSLDAFNVYAWAGDTVTSSTSLATTPWINGALGNDTTGIFFGITAGSNTTKYNYASGTGAGATSSGASTGLAYGAYGTANGIPGVSA